MPYPPHWIGVARVTQVSWLPSLPCPEHARECRALPQVLGCGQSKVTEGASRGRRETGGRVLGAMGQVGRIGSKQPKPPLPPAPRCFGTRQGL